MRLILVRHGHTTANKKGTYSGWANHRLTQEGIMQAHKLGLHLKKEIIHGAFSSDLNRAKNTAKAVLRHHPHLKLNIIRDLREAHNGKLENKSKAKYKHLDGAKLSKLYGFEEERVVLNRAKKALREMYKKHKKDTVLVVAHGWFNKIMTIAILGKSISTVRKMQTMPNTGYSIFEIDDKKSKAIILNSAKHLDKEATNPLKKYIKK